MVRAGVFDMIYTHVLNKGGRGVVSPLDGRCRNGGVAVW